MREAAFVRQNKEKWIAFERALENRLRVTSEELADYYIQLTNDLAYAQTYYPESKTLAYLNTLASVAHQKIYKNKREEGNRILRFWKTEFPLFFAKHQKSLLYSFIIFAVSVSIGIISTLNDASFVRLILGDQYVNKTIENIESGDPMGIYKDAGEFGMFVMITINNIRVAIITFVFGVITSLGTAFILFRNGIMIGAFMTFFYTQDVLYEATKTVWLHGTIEISAIIIAGCAGLIMGNSILFPGTYPRRLSFIKGAKDGLKVMISTLPFFILAGFIEGFITRYSDMPVWLAFSLIFFSLGLMLWYYIFYPLKLKRQYEAAYSAEAKT